MRHFPLEIFQEKLECINVRMLALSGQGITLLKVAALMSKRFTTPYIGRAHTEEVCSTFRRALNAMQAGYLACSYDRLEVGNQRIQQKMAPSTAATKVAISSADRAASTGRTGRLR